jgi:hypothetical protein
MTNKELLINALQNLVNEIISSAVEKDGTRWSRISPRAFNDAQNALLVIRRPRSPYQKRREESPPAS